MRIKRLKNDDKMIAQIIIFGEMINNDSENDNYSNGKQIFLPVSIYGCQYLIILKGKCR